MDANHKECDYDSESEWEVRVSPFANKLRHSASLNRLLLSIIWNILLLTVVFACGCFAYVLINYLYCLVTRCHGLHVYVDAKTCKVFVANETMKKPLEDYFQLFF